jgi:FtsP/CotA-like multicopper oxidase with cupredoxin domain
MIALAAFILAAVALPPAPIAQPGVYAPPTSTPRQPCVPPPLKTDLHDPPDLWPVNGVVSVTLTLTQQIVEQVPQLCWVYQVPVNGKTIETSIPPTINVRQGEHMSITLINTLPLPSGSIPTPPPLEIQRNPADSMGGMEMSAKPGEKPLPNWWQLMCNQPQLAPTPTQDPVTGRVFHYQRAPWNEANLHFHGLNTSPKAPGDDVVNVMLCPRPSTDSDTYHYEVDIPHDEPPGAYWYHPHAHGEAQYQVFLGLTGAIVVHTVQPSIPDKLPNHNIVIRDTPALQGIAKYHRPDVIMAMKGQPSFAAIRKEVADFKRNPGHDPFQPPNYCPGPKNPENTDNVSVNQITLPEDGNTLFNLPTAKIGYGELQYYRLFNTDAQTSLDLTLFVNGKPTQLEVTARDGVPLITKDGKPTYRPVAFNHIFIPPAGRVEFYLKGEVPGANMVIRTGFINTGCVGDEDLPRNLFNVVVGKKHVDQHIVVPPATDPVRVRFSDLAAQQPTRKRTFVFTEYLRSDQPEPDFYLTEISNPHAYEHPYRESDNPPPDTVVKDGTVEEWTFFNYTNEVHGFHIHQIHFMPIAGVTVEEGLGQLLDTVFIPHGGYDTHGHFHPHEVKVLMDFRAKDIVGTFVYHCHFLEHEDNGMMDRIQVVP